MYMNLLQIFNFHRHFILAGTYVLASKLPSSILDALVNLPHFLVSARNGLSPARSIPTGQLPPPVNQPQKAVTKTHEEPISNSTGGAEVECSELATPMAAEGQDEASSSSDEKQSNPSSNDDGDVESNAGDTSMVEKSWVNLRETHD